MRKIFPAILILICTLQANLVFSQRKPGNASKPNVVKFRPSETHTFLGNISGTSVSATADSVKNVIGLPLIITDKSGYQFQVSSFQFAYTRVGFTEDEQTGKLSPQKTMVSERFNHGVIPEVWANTIREELQSGE